MSLESTNMHPFKKSSRSERKESALGLFISLIHNRPDASEQNHKSAFRSLIKEEGYEEFLDAVIDGWLSIHYKTARRAAILPSAEEIKRNVARRRQEREIQAKVNAEAVKKAKLLIAERLLKMPTPLGKPLAECTKEECLKIGGAYTAIGNALSKGGDVVGNVLSAEEVAKIAPAIIKLMMKVETRA